MFCFEFDGKWRMVAIQLHWEFQFRSIFYIMEFIKIANFEFQILWGQGKSEHVTIVLSACFGMVLNILKNATGYSLFAGHMNALYDWVKGLWWKGWTKESFMVKIYECKGYGLCTGVRHLTAQDTSSCTNEKLKFFLKISVTHWGSYIGLYLIVLIWSSYWFAW